jgi:ABC-type sugar transport system permease subunit
MSDPTSQAGAVSQRDEPVGITSTNTRAGVRTARVFRWRRGERLGYGLVSPVVLVLLAITGFPLVYNLWNSFRNYNLYYPVAGNPFVGLTNYRDAFTQPGLVGAIKNTVAYTLVSVTVEVTLGLGVALLLNRPVRGRGLARTLILLPWAVPTVVAAIVWKTLLDPQTGAVDYILGVLHLPGAHTTWLGISTFTSWVSILVVDCWQTVPFVAIILLAGLQAIPADLYESADIDGASSWRVFSRITLPLLRPALLVVLVFRTLSAFLIFDIVYALTSGGPGTTTQTIAYLDFNTLLVNTDFGLGGAISIVMVAIALIIAGIYRIAIRPAT